jgi:hypothetical protein
MSRKDRRSLNKALKDMRVNKAYFVSVGPDVSAENYKKTEKTESEKNRLHEVLIGLGITSAEAKSRVKLCKRQRNLLGKNMRRGKATAKKLRVNSPVTAEADSSQVLSSEGAPRSNVEVKQKARCTNRALRFFRKAGTGLP